MLQKGFLTRLYYGPVIHMRNKSWLIPDWFDTAASLATAEPVWRSLEPVMSALPGDPESPNRLPSFTLRQHRWYSGRWRPLIMVHLTSSQMFSDVLFMKGLIVVQTDFISGYGPTWIGVNRSCSILGYHEGEFQCRTPSTVRGFCNKTSVVLPGWNRNWTDNPKYLLLVLT